MTAIWRNDGAGWNPLAPDGFPDEAALHSLIENSPQILPLAGSPRLIIVGREVLLGNGYADLIGVEPTGRVAIIEVKLARNAEARRAVVAQVLTYAAYLNGLDLSAFEGISLRDHLRARSYDSLAAAVRADDQQGSFDDQVFSRGLAESLAQGSFRLVIVLDDASRELIQLVGYLQAVSDKLLIDLVTVSSYTVDNSRILVPQRVDPERRPANQTTVAQLTTQAGRDTDGIQAFEASINQASEEHRNELSLLCDWARSLERDGLAMLRTHEGKGRWTLLPKLRTEDAGLVTIWNDRGAYVSVWRSMFERHAPHSIEKIENLVDTQHIGTGNYVRPLSNDLLNALRDAYREASANQGIQEAST